MNPSFYALLLKLFCNDLIICCNSKNIRIQSLSDVEKILGLWTGNEDFLLLNHLIIILKQYFYYCRNNTFKKTVPALSFQVLLLKIDSICELESRIAK